MISRFYLRFKVYRHVLNNVYGSNTWLDYWLRFYTVFIPFAFSFNPTLHFKEIQVMLLMFFALFGDIFLLEKIQGSSHAREVLHNNLYLNQNSRLGKGGIRSYSVKYVI